jgi:phosphatidylinositol alpha-1,6-mannosyltransferase
MRGISARAPGAVLLLVGGGPGARRLRRLSMAHGVAERVVFAGELPWELVPAYHAVGDVFAMPSRTRAGAVDLEGLGLASLEAAACGLPVVVGDSGGAPETVRAGETGLVVDGRSETDLVSAVGGLLADPDRAARMGAAGRDWMRTDWQWAGPVRRLRGLLGGSRRPTPGRGVSAGADQE